MTWLVVAQEQSRQVTNAKGWLIVVVVGLVALCLVVGFIMGRSDSAPVERVDDHRYWRARDAVNNLIDDAEREIRRKMWRNPRS